jgi:hypothetical protein
MFIEMKDDDEGFPTDDFRFLLVMPVGISRTDLTERAFRALWDQTSGLDEAKRFREVARMLGEDVPEPEPVVVKLQRKLQHRIKALSNCGISFEVTGKGPFIYDTKKATAWFQKALAEAEI